MKLKIYYRILTLIILLVICVVLAIYFEYIRPEPILYVLFFFIPIILSGMWYFKKAVLIAIFLGIINIIFGASSFGYIDINDVGRAAVFIAVAYVIGSINEKKAKGEQELHKLSTAIEQTVDPVYITNKHGVIEYVNPAFEKLTGYSKNEAIGKNPKILKSDKHDKTFYERLWSTILSDKIFYSDMINQKKNGELYFVERTISPIKDDHGNITHFIATGKDITERKRVEEELEKSKMRLDAATEASYIGIWELDLINDTSTRNLIHDQIFGYDKKISEWGAKIFFEHIIPEDRPSVQAAFDRAMKTNELDFECRIIWPNKIIHWITVTGKVIPDGTGKPQKMLGAVIDITERKQAEEKLFEISGRLQLATASAKAGVWDWNIQTNEMIWDDRMLELYGLTRENFPGGVEAWRQGLHPDDSARSNAECEAALRGEQDFDTEFRVLRPDGTVIHIKANGLVTRDHEGKPLRMLGLNIDITERKQIEDALKVSELRYRRLFEAAKDGILILDFETGKIVDVNPFLIDLLGYSKDNFLNKHLWEIGVFKDVMPSKDNFLALQTKEYIRYEDLPLETKDGKKIDVEFVSNVYLAGDTKIIQCNIRDVTERKQAEQVIRDATSQFQAVIQSVSEGITFSDRSGKFLVYNLKMQELTGFTMDEVNNSGDFTGLLYPQPLERQRALQRLQEIVDHKVALPFEVETTIQAKDGTKKELWVSTVEMKFKDQMMFLSIYRDITERKKMEEALRESRDYLNNLINYANAPIIVWDSQFHITRFNHAFEFITGRTEAEVMGQSLEILFPKNRVDASMELIYKALRGERWEVIEIPILHRDGSIRTVIWNSATIFSPDRKTTVSTIAQGQDITKRKQVEDALRERSKELNCLYGIADLVEKEDNLEKIFQGTVNLIVDAWYYSKVACARITWEKQESKTANFHETAWRQSANIITFGKPAGNVEVCYLEKMPDRDEGPFLGEEKNLLNAIAERLGRIIERKQAGDELKGAFQELQENQKTIGTYSRNLESLNKDLDSFAYSVSHDLRAPLRAISGFSQVLLDENKDRADDQMKHYLERIFMGTKKMGDLIDALLHFSRTTRADLQYETVDVEKIVTDIIKDQTTAHPERTIDFVVQPLPRVEADEKMVEVIFVNLIGNAVKFTSKQKKAHIEIGSRQGNDEQQFYVKDNGAGFDMKFKDKLFGAFQRLHSENVEGNGIGLTTVARLVTKHGGRVWAEGEVDKGATFYFTLPLKTSNLLTLESFQHR